MFRMDRIGTPDMFQDTLSLDSSALNAANAVSVGSTIVSQAMYGTYPETYGRVNHTHSGTRTLAAGNMLCVHWGLAMPDLSSANAAAVEYSLSTVIRGSTQDLIARPFVSMLDTQPATGATGFGNVCQFLDADVTDATGGQVMTSKGVAVFHGVNPGVIGVSKHPVVGVAYIATGAVDLYEAHTSISLRRPNYDETYPRYQDTLR